MTLCRVNVSTEGHDSSFRAIVDPGHIVAIGGAAVRLPSPAKPLAMHGDKCWLCGKWREVRAVTLQTPNETRVTFLLRSHACLFC